MALSTINGATQIRSGTVPLTALVNGYQIPTANLVDGANFLKRDGSVVVTSALNFGGTVGINAGTPSNSTDLVNKAYVDSKVNGLTVHPAVRLVVSSNISVSNPGTASFDGVTASVGDRLFLIAQTTASQNGPWVFQGSGSALTRPSDWASASVQPEGAYWISDPDGTTYKNTKFFTANTSNITVDTTSVTFTQDMSGTTYTGQNGVSISGSTVSLNYATNGGLGLSGNSAIVVPDATRGMQTSASGVGITDASTGGMLAISNASNHFTWVTASGDVTITASGVSTVNNTSGTGFTKYGNFISNETPGGSINGTNTAFTIANTPVTGSVKLYYNGDRLTPGSGNDYTISGKNITMAFSPVSNDVLIADYTV